MKISACWVVKNEAANVARSIESVKGAADELIVVDTGSTDDTVAIAAALGAKTAFFAWIDDFAAARNYAIAQASGDLILFPDADEWFDPALTAAARAAIEKIFRQNAGLEALSVQIQNLDRRSGRIISMVSGVRIFRNKPQNRYQGRIHEFLATPGGYQGSLGASSLRICHTGYDQRILPQKLRRNAAIMEAGMREAADEDEYTRYAAYLVRESYYGGEYEKAAAYLDKMLRHPEAIDRLCAFHSVNFLENMYVAVLTASRERESIPGQEIWAKLIVPIQKQYADDPACVVAPLVYQALFDLDEERFLRRLDPALQEAQRKKPSPVSVHREMTGMLLACAAQIMRRRGDKVSAMEYAVRAIGAGACGESMVTVLLDAVKGQPSADIVMLFNRVFDVSDVRQLQLLAETARRNGLAEIHAYYQKKLTDATRQDNR